MKTLKVLSFAAGIALMLSGCTGPTGPQGAPGANGANGLNGVANINIQEFSVGSGSWSFNASPAYYYANTGEGAITDPNTEAVSVTFSLGANGPWQALPANNVLNSGDQITYSWSTDLISFLYDFTSAPGVTIYFNVAVIPPAIMKRHPGMNWKDSKAVFALPEVEAAMQACHSSQYAPTK